ncbi:hypothetical protein H696_01742 [Fonticula alba]|uniref:ABC transporter domain-containing protein n=1 Tax=Fonticula alba TaxID=691883 RepID=A0A058ZD85_FONAL|nr:hypothetical protein H696_01742 [Fonticula alba]KCV72349.1 hypothetical protein H696_01742 [Fonticula alba]|eukprot:XP_009493927.1 hypothetical protein H696_01742 [Fonticula alba]
MAATPGSPASLDSGDPSFSPDAGISYHGQGSVSVAIAPTPTHSRTCDSSTAQRPPPLNLYWDDISLTVDLPKGLLSQQASATKLPGDANEYQSLINHEVDSPAGASYSSPEYFGGIGIDGDAGLFRDSVSNALPSADLSAPDFRDSVAYAPATSLPDPSKKVILSSLSGAANGSEMTALMGSSGAGKTTLLDILAGRTFNFSGRVSVSHTIPGQGDKAPTRKFDASAKELRRLSAYVTQDDVLIASFSVRETILFSARMRLPHKVPESAKIARVNYLIKLLGLSSCAETRISQVSGGQRRRTAIAVELVTSPRILFLDEPTSGLDSFTAYSVMRSLRSIARSGCTVITTIHQPSSDLFSLFDRLVLLHSGQTVFSGSAKESITYFTKIGYPCPAFTNPADHLLALLHYDEHSHEDSEEKAESPQDRFDRRVRHILHCWRVHTRERRLLEAQQSSLPSGGPADSLAEENPLLVPDPLVDAPSLPLWRELWLLLTRSMLDTIRSPSSLHIRMLQALAVSILFGTVYYKLGTHVSSVQSRTGMLFGALISVLLNGMMALILTFPVERAVFFREQQHSRSYRIFNYYMSKFLTDIPFALLQAILFSLPIYFMSGLNLDPPRRLLAFIVVNFGICLNAQQLLPSRAVAAPAAPTSDDTHASSEAARQPRDVKGLLQWSMQYVEDGFDPNVQPAVIDEERLRFLERAIAEVSIDVVTAMRNWTVVALGEAVIPATDAKASTLVEGTPSEDDRLDALESLMNTVDKLDDARDFITIGCWDRLLHGVLQADSDAPAAVRVAAAEVLATASQNDPVCQAYALKPTASPLADANADVPTTGEWSALDAFVHMAFDQADAECRKKGLLGISAVVRDYEPGLEAFITYQLPAALAGPGGSSLPSGATILHELIRPHELNSTSVRAKALFLLRHLIFSRPASMIPAVAQCGLLDELLAIATSLEGTYAEMASTKEPSEPAVAQLREHTFMVLAQICNPQADHLPGDAGVAFPSSAEVAALFDQGGEGSRRARLDGILTAREAAVAPLPTDLQESIRDESAFAATLRRFVDTKLHGAGGSSLSAA